MKKYSLIFCVSIVFVFLSSGCATLCKGYYDRVNLINASDDLQIFSKDGVEIPIKNKIERTYSETDKQYVDKFAKVIYLRSNKEHVLRLKSGGKEKLIEVYPYVGAGWVVADVLTLGFPFFLDAYTGNWNRFYPIDAGF